MNTKAKVAIAGAIVAALVALIVLDQKTAPPGAPDAAPGSTDGSVTFSPAPGADDQALRIREDDVKNLMKEANRTFTGSGSPAAPSPAPPARVVEPTPAPAQPARPSAPGAEYLVKEGDTLETIAQDHYGSRTWLSLITQANPGLRPERLRIGQKLVLPPKPEKVEKQVDEPALVKAPSAEPAVVVDGGARSYVVQPGDTLTGISSKVYKTVRHYDKIYEANRDRIADPNLLVVGTKLVMPEVAARNAAASPEAAVAVSAPPAAGKTHTVAQGESLWKIAERYAQQKGLGVLDMIQELVKANPDKLRDEKTLLRLGWQLVVPE